MRCTSISAIGRTTALLAVLYAAWFLQPAFGQKGPLTAPPEIEKFATRGKTADFIKEAGIWIERNPEADATPRLLGELLMLGKVLGSKGLEETSLAKLVLEYPESATARFALTGIKDDGAYREFLNRLANERLTGDISLFAEQFCGAVELGLKHYEQGFYQGDEFLLHVAILATEAERGMLRRAALAGLANGRPESKRLVAVAFDDKTSNTEKFVGLTEFRDSRTARQFQKVIYSRLTEAEMAEPRVLRSVAGNLLGEGKYAEALSLLGDLDDGRDPQVIYWQGLSLLAEDRPREAYAALERVVKAHPRSPWAVAAQELLPLVAGREQLTEAYARALVPVTQKFKEGIGAAEGQLAWQDAAGQTARIYFALVPSEERLEVMIQRNNRPILGYISLRGQCQVYMDGDEAIFRFQEKGLFPLPKFALEEDASGNFKLNTSLDFSDKFLGAWEANQGLLESPLLTTPAGLAKTLRSLTGSTSLPCPVDTRDGMRTFVWLAPRIDRPEISRISYVISREETLISLSSGRLVCERLRYGPRDKVVLTPPAWPRIPVVLKPRFEPIVLMKLLAGAAQLLGDEPEAPVQNASRPGQPPVRR